MNLSYCRFVEPTFNKGPDGRESPRCVDDVEFPHLVAITLAWEEEESRTNLRILPIQGSYFERL